MFLARYHRGGGRIDYGAALRDTTDLDRYLGSLSAVSPESDPQRFPRESDRLAYWINAYNAWAIRFVLDHYPFESVMDLRPPALLAFLPRGAVFFYLQKATLGTREINLYQLENRLIRRRFCRAAHPLRAQLRIAQLPEAPAGAVLWRGAGGGARARGPAAFSASRGTSGSIRKRA